MNANKKLYVDTKSDKNSGRNRRSIDFERSEVDPKDISDGKITAIKFLVDTAIGEVPISLPVRVSAAYEILKQQKKKNPRIKADLEQAERTAWKCLKDWVDAQMALIQLGLANMDEVFMPYIMDRNGNTLYEIAKERRFLLDCGNK